MVAPQVYLLYRGTGKLNTNGFYYDSTTKEIAFMTQGYNTVSVTQISGEVNDIILSEISETNPLSNPVAITPQKLVTESDISVIGQIYSTTTLRATSIPATTDTVVLQVSNLPLGTYIATGSLFGSTTVNNTGGIIQLKVTGNSTSANTIQNSGFLLSGSVNSIFQVTNTSNAVDVTLYCTNAQTVSSGRLMIVRIA
jgi:hypothetical protein